MRRAGFGAAPTSRWWMVTPTNPMGVDRWSKGEMFIQLLHAFCPPDRDRTRLVKGR